MGKTCGNSILFGVFPWFSGSFKIRFFSLNFMISKIRSHKIWSHTAKIRDKQEAPISLSNEKSTLGRLGYTRDLILPSCIRIIIKPLKLSLWNIFFSWLNGFLWVFCLENEHHLYTHWNMKSLIPRNWSWVAWVVSRWPKRSWWLFGVLKKPATKTNTWSLERLGPKKNLSHEDFPEPTQPFNKNNKKQTHTNQTKSREIISRETKKQHQKTTAQTPPSVGNATWPATRTCTSDAEEELVAPRNETKRNRNDNETKRNDADTKRVPTEASFGGSVSDLLWWSGARRSEWSQRITRATDLRGVTNRDDGWYMVVWGVGLGGWGWGVGLGLVGFLCSFWRTCFGYEHQIPSSTLMKQEEIAVGLAKDVLIGGLKL